MVIWKVIWILIAYSLKHLNPSYSSFPLSLTPSLVSSLPLLPPVDQLCYLPIIVWYAQHFLDNLWRRCSCCCFYCCCCNVLNFLAKSSSIPRVWYWFGWMHDDRWAEGRQRGPKGEREREKERRQQKRARRQPGTRVVGALAIWCLTTRNDETTLWIYQLLDAYQLIGQEGGRLNTLNGLSCSLHPHTNTLVSWQSRDRSWTGNVFISSFPSWAGGNVNGCTQAKQ